MVSTAVNISYKDKYFLQTTNLVQILNFKSTLQMANYFELTITYLFYKTFSPPSTFQLQKPQIYISIVELNKNPLSY